MKKLLLMAAGSLLGLFLLTPGAARAQEDKPLAPGWLSLDSSVGVLDNAIENGKTSIERAIGISISGFLDASYTWSSNHPRSPANITGRYFDKDQNKIVFNNFNLTLDKPEKHWGVGFHVVGDFGRTGELLREATLWNDKLQKQPSAELREAYLTFTIPFGEGLQVKGGKFVSPLGTEILPAPGSYNDNISRSFLFNFGVPLTHTGALFTYPALKVLSVSAGPITGWDDPHDNNGSPSLLAGVAFTPVDAFALSSNLIFGPEQRHNTSRQRFTWSNVATIKPIDPLTLYLEYTYGHEEKVTPSLRDGTWQGWAGIASYNWTERFNTALRGEVFRDADGVRTGAGRDLTLGEITLTGSYKFTAKLLGRVEFRQDWSDKGFYQRGATTFDSNQQTLGLQAIYTF